MTEKTVELNKNQELVLQWLKDDLKDDSDEKNTLRNLFYLQKFGYCPDDEVIEAHKTLNVRQFMEVVKEFADWTLSNHQPTFVVGEYYWGGNVIYKVLEIEEYVDTNDIQLKVLSLNDGTTHEDTMYMEYPFDDDKPATAEQITTFKCAEIKREIGLIIKKGDADWIEIVEDIEEYLAEELQEVGKNTPKIRNKLNDPFHVTKRQVNVDCMVIADD